MNNEKDILDIQRVVKETIELSYHSQRGDGMNIYKVDSVDGEAVSGDNILLIGINRDKPTPRVNASNAIALAHLDFSTYYGTIEIFLCKKKKGLFGKETLKTVDSDQKTYYTPKVEKGEDKLKLKDWL